MVTMMFSDKITRLSEGYRSDFHFLITSYIFRSNTLRICTSKRSGIDYVEGKRGRHIFSYSFHILSARHSPPFFIELAPQGGEILG